MKFKTMKLSELTVDGRGHYGIGASAVEKSDELYAYLRITDIYDDGTLNKAGLKSVDDPDAEKYLLKPNDIVFARTGNSVGKSYFYDERDGAFVYAGFLIKFSLDPAKVNPRFVKYYCQSQRYKNWVASFSTGSTRGNINAQTYGDMEILTPCRAQQDFLVEILSALDDKIELNRRINANLEQQAAAIFKSKFCDFDDNAGQMPSKWNVATFGEIAEVVSGKRPPMKQPEFSEDVNVPLVGASTIMGYTNNILYNEPILVIGRVGTHGVVQRFQTPCWPSDNTLVIKSEYYEYAFHFLKNVDYVNMNRGSTQPLITQTDLKNLLIVLPEKRVLKEFEKLTGTLMARWETNRAENEQLAAVRDALLPRLMSGKIDVSDVSL